MNFRSFFLEKIVNSLEACLAFGFLKERRVGKNLLACVAHSAKIFFLRWYFCGPGGYIFKGTQRPQSAWLREVR